MSKARLRLVLRLVKLSPNDDKNEQVPVYPKEVGLIYDSKDGVVPRMAVLLVKKPQFRISKDYSLISLDRKHQRLDAVTYGVILPKYEITWDYQLRLLFLNTYPSTKEYILII